MNTAVINTEETMPKKEFQNVQLQEVDQRGGMRLALNNFAELEKFSHFMALSNFVPKHLRAKQADCLAVLLQSMRWEMDPFAVAQKTYFVNDGMAYEAQLVNAIVLSRAQLKSRPKITWSGEGEGLKCKVEAMFIGEEETREFEAEIKTITTRNSPLWKQQPKQQLAYFALRAWARLYCPDVLMGVYTKDEVEDASMNFGPDNAINITPEPEIMQGIEAGIKAEKEAASEKPKNKKPPAHDPVTGEIIEQDKQAVATEKSAGDAGAPAAEPLQPAKIPARAMADDGTKTDWYVWVEEWERLVAGMTDAQSLNKLQKLNESVLGNMKTISPANYEHCIEKLTLRMTELGGVEGMAA